VELFKHVLYTSTPPVEGLEPLHTMKLDPGTYFLNVVNMSNELNEFRVAFVGNVVEPI
jgi:hypothetical protein